MNKLSLTKVIGSVLVAGFILVSNPIRANAEWKQDANGWWNTEGNSLSVGWKEIDGKWYYFEDNGYMAHDTTVDGYKLGSDGAWIQSDISTSKVNKSDIDQDNENSFNVDVSIKYNVYLDDKVKGTDANIIRAARKALFDNNCYFAKYQHYNGYSVNADILIFNVKETGTDEWEVDFYSKGIEEKEYDKNGYGSATVNRQKDGSYTGGIISSDFAYPEGITW
jgi:FOG: Glucan-binding domain (YG repeat)